MIEGLYNRTRAVFKIGTRSIMLYDDIVFLSIAYGTYSKAIEPFVFISACMVVVETCAVCSDVTIA